MTDRDITRSLIHLNHFDMDGLIDIARNGLNTDLTPITRQLIQRLAIAIVEPIAPEGGLLPLDLEADEPVLFEGNVALAVYPLEQLKQLAANQGGYDDANR